MAEAKWIKIVTDIFDDEKVILIEDMPEADSIIVIWFKLLCLAGKQNNCGVFMLNDKIAYTDKMFSTIFRRKESTVKMALAVFEQLGMIEMYEDVITIPNWGKHQNLDQLEKKRDYMRNYMADYRQNQKQIACKTNSKTNVNQADKKRKEKNREDNNTNAHFEQFWNVYPKKISKANALKSFEKIKCDDELLNIILSAIHTQSQSEQWQKDNGKYIPYPATWLNQHRWEDELSVSAKQGYTNSLADIDFSKIKNPFEEEI